MQKPDPTNPELTATLERALLRELVSEWHRVNAAHFKDALARPSIVLSTTASRLGRWIEEARTIELQRAMVLKERWPVVVEVLKHEMAHQYAHEILGASGETAHGPAFRATCVRLGIYPASSGLPRTGEEADPESTRIVERIARLLALAESPNVHEAEAAAAAAQRLMLKHNVDLLGTQRSGAPARDFEVRHLGAPTGRVEESARILAGILGKHFFVEVLWIPVYRPLEGKRGSVLEIGGTRANVAMAEYVHAFLTRACDSLWVDHKRADGLRSNRHRRTFQAGVMSGFAAKLAREAKRLGKEDPSLVWVKDGDLDAWFRRRHPHVRNVRYGGARRPEQRHAYDRGREAGEAIVLRRGIEAAASGRGRLLPP
jgi:hypothetical protein